MTRCEMLGKARSKADARKGQMRDARNQMLGRAVFEVDFTRISNLFLLVSSSSRISHLVFKYTP
jgi:hypothetical protein